MHIVSLKMLREFWQEHPQAKQVLSDWHSAVENAEFANFNDVKRMFNTADYVPPYTIFDIGGNNYRVVTAIHYNVKKVFVRFVMTHREYDVWNKLYRKGKV